MEPTLIDRELVGEFVDKLIAKKYPGEPASKFAGYREECIQYLDQKITDAMLSSLSETRLKELSTMIDENKITSLEVLSDFFREDGIDLIEVVERPLEDFGKSMLEGQSEKGGQDGQ